MYIGTLIAIGLLGILTALMFSRRTIKKIVRIHRAPVSVIGTLPTEGQVEIVGKAECETTVKSPISQEECVMWHLVVKERQGVRYSHWVTLYDNISTETFDINDGTGKVQVELISAEIVLRDNIRKSSGLFHSLNLQMQGALKKLNIDTTGFLGLNKNIRLYERYVKPEEQIYVLGKVVYRNNIKSIMSEKNSPLIISNYSKRQLLGSLYWKVISRLILYNVLTVFLIFLVYSLR